MAHWWVRSTNFSMFSLVRFQKLAQYILFFRCILGAKTGCIASSLMGRTLLLNTENRSVFLNVVLEVRVWKLKLPYGSCMPAVW